MTPAEYVAAVEATVRALAVLHDVARHATGGSILMLNAESEACAQVALLARLRAGAHPEPATVAVPAATETPASVPA